MLFHSEIYAFAVKYIHSIKNLCLVLLPRNKVSPITTSSNKYYLFFSSSLSSRILWEYFKRNFHNESVSLTYACILSHIYLVHIETQSINANKIFLFLKVSIVKSGIIYQNELSNEQHIDFRFYFTKIVNVSYKGNKICFITIHVLVFEFERCILHLQRQCLWLRWIIV